MSETRDYFAYFDESGTHGEAPVLILGGLLGTRSEFAELVKRLNAISEKYGFDIFHAVDVRHGKGVFRGWSPQTKLQLAVEYSNLIEELLTAAAAASLVKEDYRSIYRNDSTHRKVPKDSAYGLCFRMCLTEFLQTIEETCSYRTAPYRLSITAEDGARNVEDARRIFEETRSTALNVMGVDPSRAAHPDPPGQGRAQREATGRSLAAADGDAPAISCLSGSLHRLHLDSLHDRSSSIHSALVHPKLTD
jgi:hypothetical protein